MIARDIVVAQSAGQNVGAAAAQQLVIALLAEQPVGVELVLVRRVGADRVVALAAVDQVLFLTAESDTPEMVVGNCAVHPEAEGIELHMAAIRKAEQFDMSAARGVVELVFDDDIAGDRAGIENDVQIAVRDPDQIDIGRLDTVSQPYDIFLGATFAIGVDPVAEIIPVDIGAGRSSDQVRAQTADQQVVPPATIDRVGPDTALHRVVARS